MVYVSRRYNGKLQGQAFYLWACCKVVLLVGNIGKEIKIVSIGLYLNRDSGHPWMVPYILLIIQWMNSYLSGHETDNWNWIPWFEVRILVLKYNFHWLPLWVVTLSPKTLNVCVCYCTTNRITIKSFDTCSYRCPCILKWGEKLLPLAWSSLLVSSDTAATKQRCAPLRLLPKIAVSQHQDFYTDGQ